MSVAETHRPTRLGSMIALGTGVLATTAVGVYSPTALTIGLLGLLVLAIGLVLPRPGLLTLGAVGLFGAAVVGALDEVPIGAVLVATIGAVLAWDVAHNAASHARQVGANAQTGDAEALHAAASFGAGIITAGIVYLGYRAVAGGQPSMAVGILLLGSVIAVMAFR